MVQATCKKAKDTVQHKQLRTKGGPTGHVTLTKAMAPVFSYRYKRRYKSKQKAERIHYNAYEFSLVFLLSFSLSQIVFYFLQVYISSQQRQKLCCKSLQIVLCIDKLFSLFNKISCVSILPPLVSELVTIEIEESAFNLVHPLTCIELAGGASVNVGQPVSPLVSCGMWSRWWSRCCTCL